MAWPGHAELKSRAEKAEFDLKAKTAELEIADGEIERLKARSDRLDEFISQLLGGRHRYDGVYDINAVLGELRSL